MYSYDDRNRPVSIETLYGGVNKTYGYDLLDRLNQTLEPWGTIDYTYDPVGNRLSKSVQGGSSIMYTYDEMDRISSASGLGFDWDTNGNLVYKHDGVDAWNYTYDPLNRLTQVQKNSVLSALYTYDAGGRRVRSWDTVDGSTDYVYSGLQVIDEVCGGVHERRVYAGGVHIASNTTGTVEYYHVDHLGSTRLKTNSTGGVVYESDYEPFGVSNGENGDEDYRYTGKQEDPSGLYYYGARYYDPDTGRFINRDTFSGYRSDPQSLNKYSYCLNNPQKYTDPDGKDPVTASIIITGGIIKMGVDMHAYYAHNPNCLESIEGITGLGIAGVGGFVEGTITTAGYMLGGPVGILIDLGADVIAWDVEQTLRHASGLEVDTVNIPGDQIEYTVDKGVKKIKKKGVETIIEGLNMIGSNIELNGPFNVIGNTITLIDSTIEMSKTSNWGVPFRPFSEPTKYDVYERDRTHFWWY